MICLNYLIFYELHKFLCTDSKFVNIQQIGQYFCKQMSAIMFCSARSQHRIQTKNLLMWWENLFPEDLHRPWALVQFLLDQAKLKSSDLVQTWVQTSPYLPKGGIKGNLSDCCTFLGNMYYTQDLRLVITAVLIISNWCSVRELH